MLTAWTASFVYRQRQYREWIQVLSAYTLGLKMAAAPLDWV